MTMDRTLDPKEAAHYTKLADTWWDREGPMWPLHKLNQLRIGWIEQQLKALGYGDPSRPLAGLRVLDIGCGGGILSESLAKRGALVHAIDPVERNIRVATKRAIQTRSGVEFEHASVETLVERGFGYDIVFNMEVVEHVADFDVFMDACNALVRPGGAMFVATINRNPLSGLIAIFGAEYVLRWLPRGTHQYHKLVRPSELREALERGGLTAMDWAGVKVNPINRRFSIQRSLMVNYMTVARKPLKHAEDGNGRSNGINIGKCNGKSNGSRS